MNKNISEYSRMEHGKAEAAAQKALNHLYIVLIIGILCYYIMPFLCGLYLGGNKDVFNYILLYINTVYSFGSCYIHAVKNGFKWYVPVAVGLFFVPSCMAFGYISVSLMGLVYVVLGMFGSFTGFLMYRRKNGKGYYQKKRERKAVRHDKKNKNVGKA
ncbi:MAG: hypothetical protein K2I03_05055 [Lachnospiraceae bacterium]|nr:hypothetical protein [Lachnospiraceae bacterium]MDE6232444.1 hypothetical protein [Lachnospiraceae bacterium]MDE6251060.1 hypothetical protein [Lachnospiraceae bacterium]